MALQVSVVLAGRYDESGNRESVSGASGPSQPGSKQRPGTLSWWNPVTRGGDGGTGGLLSLLLHNLQVSCVFYVVVCCFML